MTELERNRMQEMIRRLNEASEAYYGGRDEIMSNFEWDALFDKVKALEASLSESSRTRQVLVEVNNAGGELLAGS